MDRVSRRFNFRHNRFAEGMVQSHRIGDLAVAAMPFEVFAEIGLGLKVRSPIHPLTNISITNGSHGYLPNPERHHLGGYETGLVSTKHNSTPQSK